MIMSAHTGVDHLSTPSPEESPTEPPVLHIWSAAPDQAFVPPIRMQRRQSQLDPIARDYRDRSHEDAHGEFGNEHHQLKVTQEDLRDRSETLNLPGIKALFGNVPYGVPLFKSDRPTISPLSQSGSILQSPSVPSLVAASPHESPSTARTSHYSSITSSSESHFNSGWWTSDSDARISRYSPSMHAPVPTRPYLSEHRDKRRRSDGPPPLRDAEESTRLRWQAQSRNASFPASDSTSPFFDQVPQSMTTHRAPLVSSATLLSYSSLPGPSREGTWIQHPLRRPSTTPRHSSFIRGQLAQTLEGLTASDLLLPSSEMRLMHLADRRNPPCPPLPVDHATPSTTSLQPLRDSLGLSFPPKSLSQSGRQSPSGRSPNPTFSAVLRRPSLSEVIKARSGDNEAVLTGRFHHDAPRNPKGQPALSRPVAIKGWTPDWPTTGDPTDTRNAGFVGPVSGGRSGLTRKRHTGLNDGVDLDLPVDAAMRGMEMLAESAQRVSGGQRKLDATIEERDGITGKASAGGPRYTCKECTKGFFRPSSLTTHMYSRKSSASSAVPN